ALYVLPFTFWRKFYLPLHSWLLLRNGDVEWRNLAESIEAAVKFLGVSHHENRDALGMNVLLRDALYIRGCDFFNARTVALQKIRGVAVELVAHALEEDLLLRIKFKNERIQDGVFGFLELRLSDPAFDQQIDLLAQRVDGRRGAGTLGTHLDTQD